MTRYKSSFKSKLPVFNPRTPIGLFWCVCVMYTYMYICVLVVVCVCVLVCTYVCIALTHTCA